MSAAIIPFNQSGNLPAYAAKRRGLAADLTTGVGPGFPKLSIKGKTWAVTRGGERTVLMNPKDPESPASYIGLVIVKSNPALSRAYYAKQYDPKAADAEQKPDCASTDGVRPDVGVPSPQAKTCAGCAHAVYGSGQNGKGFRCGNHRRLVVAQPGKFGDDDLMLLQVPGGSLKNLAAFAKLVDGRGFDYNMVLAKLSFDKDEESPRIVFEPVGLLPEAMYEQVAAAADGEQARAILGTPVTEVANGEVAPAEAKKPEPEPEPEKPAAKPRAATKKTEPEKPAKVEVPEDDLAAVLAGEEPEAKPAAPAKGNGKADAIGDDLDAMLAEFED